MTANTNLPLDGVRVLDLSRVLAAPFCTQALGDLGAEVIKVEHPVRGDDTRDWGERIGETESTYYNSANRNKISIAVDLQAPEGLEIIKKLLAQCDVVIHNFKTGGMEKMGLSYETIKDINPSIVFCAISGYDNQGPEASRPGYDLVIQAETGLMSINGTPEIPPVKFGVAVVDMVTGMYASQAILAALYKRKTTGIGAKIEMSLYDCGASISAYYGLDALTKERTPIRVGNGHPSIVPYGIFDTKDKPVIVAVGNSSQFDNFCKHVICRPDIPEDERYSTNVERIKNRDTLLPMMRRYLLEIEGDVVLSRMKAAGIPCGEVSGLYEGLSSTRSQDVNLVTKVAHPLAGDVWVFTPPYKIDGAKPPIRFAPPTLGSSTDRILANYVGLDRSGIDALHQRRVIR
jgi:crotonobetainyl-CoA:carnitine CoA-transferase CaiB-like acyl-CoA transferase